MSKKIPVLLLKDHPTLSELDTKTSKTMKELEAEFIKIIKLSENVTKDFWQKVEAYLVSEGIVPDVKNKTFQFENSILYDITGQSPEQTLSKILLKMQSKTYE